MQIFLSNHGDSACIFKENVPIETFNITFDSTQNKQQYGTKITYIDVGGGGRDYGEMKFDKIIVFFLKGRGLRVPPFNQPTDKETN